MKPMRFQRSNVWDWSAFDQLTNFQDEFNNLLESAFPNGGASDVFSAWAPRMDVYEDKESFIVRAELPGMKKDAIEIKLHENVLTVSGERKSEKPSANSRSSREERAFGSFTRSLVLRKSVDGSRVGATYKDGILTVTLPKAEEAKPRSIEIRAN